MVALKLVQVHHGLWPTHLRQHARELQLRLLHAHPARGHGRVPRRRVRALEAGDGHRAAALAVHAFERGAHKRRARRTQAPAHRVEEGLRGQASARARVAAGATAADAGAANAPPRRREPAQ